jgi:16S rRNA (uracil1498-N3)-methyltransferase
VQLHRFYLPPDECKKSPLILGGDEAHHALRVLRLKEGDSLLLLDGCGNEFNCEISTVEKRALRLRVLTKKSFPAPPCRVTLLQCVPRGKIIESIIQKATELGVARIVPILSERVVTDLDERDAKNKAGKWQHVAIESIKQCGAAWLPEVEAPVTPRQFVERKEVFDLALVGSLQDDAQHPHTRFDMFRKQHGRAPASAAMWIGPEGDFTPAEMDVIKASGALPITFGNLVLRVETAAIYSLSIMSYEVSS